MLLQFIKDAQIFQSNQKKDLKQELFGDPDTVLFKHNEENFLLEKINEIREHYTTPARLRTVEQTMGLLAGTKSFVDKFFDNVKVNDENEQIKKKQARVTIPIV